MAEFFLNFNWKLLITSALKIHVPKVSVIYIVALCSRLNLFKNGNNYPG